ncbi:hypothetical protein GCM10007416_29300 [Kroppenstedtia guangzhouensis]|uniref:Chorismate-utilising enzyme C-terminal domain-containing protein n=1 Tax=Kroppenstedtia guangzhouensis TaxID=1274356 RepID=A0ABQ1H1A7_9BACL|nr:aminotransferase class IV [Kroppenstedtia guangzhouensis]GGA54239.1 hypothetical protein GCM10007416_29300 [Kroppenstedtia guangzhouensis]
MKTLVQGRNPSVYPAVDCTLEALPLWHQVAKITGPYREGTTAGKIFRSAFPGGSITGAPKLRFMQVIHELENGRRGFYTGSIGYLDARGNAEWNIAIRTVTWVSGERGTLSYHVGGGIVAIRFRCWSMRKSWPSGGNGGSDPPLDRGGAGRMKWIVVNGQAYCEREARISPQNRGALFGDGLFETFRVEKGIPLFLQEHLDRLARSAKKLHFVRIPDQRELIGSIREAIQLNRVQSGYLRLTLTRGNGAFGLSLMHLDQPCYWVEAQEHSLNPLRYQQGIGAIIYQPVRNPCSPIAGIKSLHFLESILAREAAENRGAQEAILPTVEGDLCEGASSNLFLVKDGKVITPGLDRGPLPGVAREWVIHKSLHWGIAVEETRILSEDLQRAEEMFFTNSTWGPFPCVEVDGSSVGAGTPGRVTRMMIRAWREEIRRQTEG